MVSGFIFITVLLGGSFEESRVGELSWLEARLLLLSLFIVAVSFNAADAVFAFGGGS